MPEPIALFDRNNYFCGDRKPEQSFLIALEEKGSEVKSKIKEWEESIQDLKKTYSGTSRLKEGLEKLESEYKKLVNDVFSRSTIQIGFLGQSNAGKSRWLNELCEAKDMAKIGKTARPTSSAIVRYTHRQGDDARFRVKSFSQDALKEKYKILIEHLQSKLKIFNLSESDNALDAIRNKLPSDEKQLREALEKEGLFGAWTFVNKFKDGSLKPYGDKKLDTHEEFHKLVNHSGSLKDHSESVYLENLCTQYGEAPFLPATFPKILEIVDVPGVDAAALDDFMVREYSGNIDAWFFMFKNEIQESTGITEIADISKEKWAYSREGKSFGFNKRFGGGIGKFASWSPEYTEVKENWQSLKATCEDVFFFLEAEPKKKIAIPQPLIVNENNEQFELFFIESSRQVIAGMESKDGEQARGIFSKVFSHFKKEYLSFAKDGSREDFKEFFLVKWPVMIADEIASKGLHDLDSLLEKLSELKADLEAAKALTLEERMGIINGVVALQNAKRSLTTGTNDVLKNGVEEIRKECQGVIELGADAFEQNLHKVDNVLEFLRNVSIQCGSIILKGLITDVIKRIYAQIENDHKFSSLKVRLNIKSSETTSLQEMWKKTIPLGADRLDPLLEKIKKGEVTYQQLAALLDDGFKSTIFAHTGLDELLHGLYKNAECLLTPWVKELLDLDYQANYPRLRRLVLDCVDNTLIDAVQITKVYVLAALDKNLILLQDLEKKIS